MSPRWQRFLVVYATVVSIASAFLAVAGFAGARPGKVAFDEIDVHRINVVEPDGTLRMTISNRARLPGIIRHGKEEPFDRPQAGILFYNDEASEVGGLIFGGRKDAKGDVTDSGGSLSFDRYGGNQIVQLIGVHDKEDRFAGLAVTDSPPGGPNHRRIWVGTDETSAASVALTDRDGKKRVVLEVAPDGAARLVFLDVAGKPVREIKP